jgi:hypothetical protein
LCVTIPCGGAGRDSLYKAVETLCNGFSLAQSYTLKPGAVVTGVESLGYEERRVGLIEVVVLITARQPTVPPEAAFLYTLTPCGGEGGDLGQASKDLSDDLNMRLSELQGEGATVIQVVTFGNRKRGSGIEVAALIVSMMSNAVAV